MKADFRGAIPGLFEAGNPDEHALDTILIESGRLSREDAARVARLRRETGLGFEDAAVSLGLLKHADIEFAISRQFDYPYLVNADIPGMSPELVAASQPFSHHVESLRTLRSRLVLQQAAHKTLRQTIAVIGPGHGDGRSHLAANLAIVFAQLGERTLLLDADMRHPRLHDMFGLKNDSGLSSVLSGQCRLLPVRKIAPFPNLSVLTAGPPAPNPQELIGRELFAKLLASLEASFQVVLIDTPAGNDYADAQMIAVRAGSALMAVRRRHTSLEDSRRISAELSQHGVRILGAVLNDF